VIIHTGQQKSLSHAPSLGSECSQLYRKILPSPWCVSVHGGINLDFHGPADFLHCLGGTQTTNGKHHITSSPVAGSYHNKHLHSKH